ncbi:MAG: ABC transporter permease [Candidatus Dormiibacterota bacterium]
MSSQPSAAPATSLQAAESAGLLGDAWRDLRHNPLFCGAAVLVLLLLLMAVLPQLFAGWFGHGNPSVCNLSSSDGGPIPGHPFGFDIQGCDLYANVIYGARASISVGLLVTAVDLVFSVVLGALAAYYGGVIDTVISRLTDIFFGFPFILGALVILAVVPARNVLTVSMILALFNWPPFVRLMRSTVIATKDHEYVIAARAMGASDRFLLLRHIVPNALAPVLVIATLGVGQVIVAEATLTFLGIGLQAPAISWGLELSTAQTYFQRAPHLLIFPAGFLAVTVLAFIVLGDAVRDALDPRLR